MSIPKKIHYCWFGGNPLPELAQKCIDSWKKYLPDYEIIRWDESNFDFSINDYVREAYENKKWAFITDYVRLYVLYNYGGIYMDTDVEVLKPLDELLTHKAFSGFEDKINIPTGIIASEKHNKWIKYLLDYYKDRHFIVDGKINYTTNVLIITEMTKKKYGLKQNNTYQDLKDVVFYPNDYFCPKDHINGEIYLTDNTYCIHHFSGSWQSKGMKFREKVFRTIHKIFGRKVSDFMYKLYKKIVK